MHTFTGELAALTVDIDPCGDAGRSGGVLRCTPVQPGVPPPDCHQSQSAVREDPAAAAVHHRQAAVLPALGGAGQRRQDGARQGEGGAQHGVHLRGRVRQHRRHWSGERRVSTGG